MIRVNFTNSFTRSCTPNDYYMWTPYDAVSLFIVVYCCLLLFVVVYCCSCLEVRYWLFVGCQCSDRKT